MRRLLIGADAAASGLSGGDASGGDAGRRNALRSERRGRDAGDVVGSGLTCGTLSTSADNGWHFGRF